MEFLSLQQGADKVLRLSHRMLETAEQGEWDLLGQLEQERSRSLDSLFQHPQMPNALPTIAHALQQVMELDRRCIALGQQARDAMAAEIKQQSQGQHAVRRYLDCQG
ncbi:MAG: hypothetical protein GC149_05960 [Gammaproteobacteria bacterium]|nr:hypothetical protein [Gammaproteobacteria bacterium]